MNFHYYILVFLLLFGANCFSQDVAVIDSLNEEAVIYAKQGDMQKASEIFLRCYNEALKTDDEVLKDRIANNLGNVFSLLKDHNKAIKYYKISLKSRLKDKDTLRIIDSYNNLTALYIGTKEYSKALDYAKEAYSLSKQIKNEKVMALSLHNTGSVYGKLKKPIKALEYYLLAKPNINHDPYFKAQNLCNIGASYSDIANDRKAILFYREAQVIADKNRYKEIQKGIYYGFMKSFRTLNQHDSAWEYQEKWALLKDSLYNRRLTGAIQELEANYEAAAKDKKIAELARKGAEANLKAEENQKWLAIMGIGIIVIIMLAMLIIGNSKSKRQKQALMFVSQRVELEQKALRAQMNPHFMFNALNSIQSLIASDKNEKAAIYLAEFSKLMRLALDASLNNQLTLSEEIEIIEKYLTLEKLRFKEKFEWSINVNNILNKEKIIVPSMFIQPIIESAIIHGVLKDNSESGKIEVEISLNEKQQLQVEVYNNGAKLVGSYLDEESFGDGLSIVKQRIMGMDNRNTFEIKSIEDKGFVTCATMILNKTKGGNDFNYCLL